MTPGRLSRLLVTAAAALTLALTGAVQAGATDFGGSTGAPPNTNFGCEAYPGIVNGNGDYGLYASGQPTCTWAQLPTNGGAANGAAPFSGRVTAVRVRSGPNPAPLRFTVLQSRSGLAADGTIIPNSTQCCFGERMTGTVQMQPNAVTTVALNLPVFNEKRPNEGLVITDMVGVSATSNAGALPVRLTDNPNSSHFAQPGVPSVLMHYPEIRPNQVRTDGFSAPDHLITAVFTMCAARGSSAKVATPSNFKVGGTCGARVTAKSRTAKKGKVKIPLKCIGSCSGKIKIVRAKGKGTLGSTKKFSIGKKGQVKVKLTKAGKRATAGKRTVRAKVVVKAQGTTTKKVITLR